MTVEIQSVRNQLLAMLDGEGDVQVAMDPLGGYRVQIVSNKFRTMQIEDRRRAVFEVLRDEDIALLRLLDPSEVEEGEIPSIDEPRYEATMWPASIARGQQDTIEVRLPSQVSDGLSRPVVATFYSLRGGVGRSTALVHTAFVLARQGFKVLCLDMDLEAPGLASLFGVDELVELDMGVVPLLTRIDYGLGIEPEDLDRSSIRVTEDLDLSVIPAGLPSAAYAFDLGQLDPASWYREGANPLRDLMAAIRGADDEVRPDIILIDSRTGITPIAAPLLFDVADVAVVTFLPHPQAREGTALLTRALLAAQSERLSEDHVPLTPEPRFLISPVPSLPESVERARDRAEEWISEWLSPARDGAGEKPFEVIDDLMHLVTYSEVLAASDFIDSDSNLEPFEPVAAWIAGLLVTDSPVPVVLPDGPGKDEVLASLDFVAESAESSSIDTLRQIFVGTESVNDALDPNCPLVLGRKGTGKTLVFRQLSDRPDSIPVTSPVDIQETARSWLPNPDLYRALNSTLEESGERWEIAWMAIIGLTLRKMAGTAPIDVAQVSIDQGDDYRLSSFVSDIRTLIALPDAGLVLREWITEIDEHLDGQLLLLFDGLDTGFAGDRKLRNRAVTGLLQLTNDLGLTLSSLKMKVFIREDIWRAVELPNKSHLRARAAQLAWNDMTDYLRIALQQAWRSEAFRDYVRLNSASLNNVKNGRAFDFNVDIEYWPESIVRRVWQLLVGERVAGGKTAFTDNWVWYRLADANGDHSPRHLVQLLNAATIRERDLERDSPFSRTLVRPRALVDALEDVSQRALDALRNEEFTELEPVLEKLEQEVSETPFDASELRDQERDLLNLGEEVGLLERVQAGDATLRYRVPEIYRMALGMARRGQR